MTIKLMLAIIAVLTICVIIFKKTVSNDAENDYRLRDILAKNSEEDEEEKIQETVQPVKQEYNTEALNKNVYEELANEQTTQKVQTVALESVEEEAPQHTETKITYNTNNYSTQVHNTDYKQDVYYEKINDDACEDTTYQKEIYNDDHYEIKEEDEEKYSSTTQKNINRPQKSLLGYIKTFWRGVTFTAGACLCLCAVYGLVEAVQTSNDAIIYSIWLLAGIILIK